jgi:hypothetical protein
MSLRARYCRGRKKKASLLLRRSGMECGDTYTFYHTFYTGVYGADSAEPSAAFVHTLTHFFEHRYCLLTRRQVRP